MYIHAYMVCVHTWCVCTRVGLFVCVCMHTQVHTHTCLRGLCVYTPVHPGQSGKGKLQGLRRTGSTRQMRELTRWRPISREIEWWKGKRGGGVQMRE